jgi:hypothetical protein
LILRVFSRPLRILEEPVDNLTGADLRQIVEEFQSCRITGIRKCSFAINSFALCERLEPVSTGGFPDLPRDSEMPGLEIGSAQEEFTLLLTCPGENSAAENWSAPVN